MTVVNTWFVMIPPGYASKSDAEKELVDFRVQYPAGSKAWNDANAGRILSADESTMGQELVKWKGPYATEAEAQTAQAPRQQSPNPLNDATNAAENATGGLGGALAAIGKFLAKLGQASTWLRVAEVGLGLVLVAVGVAKLVPAFTPATAIARRFGA